jgi:sec-independent protein translocase protein TatB
MNFLGMGPLELMLIVVLALIVFGPAKLPEIMGQVGRAIGDFRRATSELSDEFNRTIQAELNETKATIEETKSALTDVRSAVDSTMSETRAAITGAGTMAPARVSTPAVETPVANGTNHDDGANNGVATAESSPPLADATQWSWETSPTEPVETAAAPAEADSPSTDPAAPTGDATIAETPSRDVTAASSETVEAAAPSSDDATATEPSRPSATRATGQSTTKEDPSASERVARDELQPPY